VNKAFEVELLAVVPHRLAVEVELDDIRGRDQFRGERARAIRKRCGWSGWRTLTWP